MSAINCPYTSTCQYTLLGDCSSMVDETVGRCWMCGDLAISSTVVISDEYLGDNGENPCFKCLKKMIKIGM